MFNHVNAPDEPPKKGDTIVIETKRNKGRKVILTVDEIVRMDGCVEVIIQSKRNKYFNWDMYKNGESWVWRVWNLGQITFTASTNTMLSIDDI